MSSNAHQDGVRRGIKWLEEQKLEAMTLYTFTYLRYNGEVCTFRPDIVGLKQGVPVLFIEVGSIQTTKTATLARFLPLFHWPYEAYGKRVSEELHEAGGCWNCMVNSHGAVRVYVGDVRAVMGKLLQTPQTIAEELTAKT